MVDVNTTNVIKNLMLIADLNITNPNVEIQSSISWVFADFIGKFDPNYTNAE